MQYLLLFHCTVVARTLLSVTFVRTLPVFFLIVLLVYEPFNHKQECIATLVLYEAEVLVTELYVFHQSAECINPLYGQHLTELIFPPVQHTVESASGEPFLMCTKLVLG